MTLEHPLTFLSFTLTILFSAVNRAKFYKNVFLVLVLSELDRHNSSTTKKITFNFHVLQSLGLLRGLAHGEKQISEA